MSSHAPKLAFRCFDSVRVRGVFLFALLLPFLSGASGYYNDWAAAHFSDIPAQSGISADPDDDGEANLIEFVFGTDPRVGGGIVGAVNPISGAAVGTNGAFSVEILEQQGHQPGAQLDLYLSSNLSGWFRPWWFRVVTNSLPTDPVGSVRENFTTQMPGTNQWFVRSSAQLIDAGVTAANYYVATNGSDSNNGTSTNTPFASLSKAVGLANPGNLIYVRGGTYSPTAATTLSRNGSPTQPIRVRAFPGEHPVLYFAAEPSGSPGVQITGNWWWVYGLEIVKAGHNGILIRGNSNVVERCVVHESGDTGIHITAGSGSQTASSNLVLNCDSYRNYDPPIGGNADGFSAKFTVGPNNVFRGCRSWNNSDDGWDFWMATNMIIVDRCMTFSNGFNVFDADPSTNTMFDGNGNGFKMGGNYQPGPHHFLNCVSFGNRINGFDQNNNTAGQTLDNCTSFGNGGRNFELNHDSTNAPMIGVHVIRNNLTMAGHTSDAFRSGSLLTNNSWQLLAPMAGFNDVLSHDGSVALLPRRDDGGLAETPFLRPVPGGRLVDKGVNTGQSYIGSAPDLGAYETPEW